jgi:phage I-like protein
VFCSAERGFGQEDCVWTPKGEEFARNYPDISPAVLYDEKTMEVLGLASSGLVPAGGVIGLSFFSALSNPIEGSTNQETKMDPKELKAQFDALASQFAELKKLVEGMLPKEQVAAMSAKVDGLETAIKPLATLKADVDAGFAKRDKDALLVQAAFSGKVVTLTDEAISKLSVDDLRQHIDKLQVTVPLHLRTASFAPKVQEGEGTLLAQFNAIQDPVKRGQFFQKHGAKIFSES